MTLDPRPTAAAEAAALSPDPAVSRRGRMREPPTLDPRTAARSARLRYVSDQTPGIARQRRGRGFVYRRPDGTVVRDPQVLRRVRDLVIPPAWTDVWICLDPTGHLQAVGRDVRGRKQYRYHARWREVRDQTKFEHMLAFADALPAIRAQVQADLRRHGLPREKVLAAVVRLLERTLGRVGNTEYAQQNDSFGLTTLQRRHARVGSARGSGRIELDFRGKHGVRYHQVLNDATLARIVRRCGELPGRELFKYTDAKGRPHRVSSEHVNRYLRGITGLQVTAKDFRTWAATLLAVAAIVSLGPIRANARTAAAVVRTVACHLGNTPAVCRRSYIHPQLLADYLDGTLHPHLGALQRGAGVTTLEQIEAVVRSLLKRWNAG